MHPRISHDRSEENQAAKARWFQSLSMRERADLLCEFTDMILEINPRIVDRKNAQPVAGRILVIKAGREVDLDDVRLLSLGDQDSLTE